MQDTGVRQKAGEINEQLKKAVEKRKIQIGKHLAMRVKLPVLNETESRFTVLDQIALPITYLNEEIGKINE